MTRFGSIEDQLVKIQLEIPGSQVKFKKKLFEKMFDVKSLLALVSGTKIALLLLCQ